MKHTFYLTTLSVTFAMQCYLPGRYQDTAARYWELTCSNPESPTKDLNKALMLYNLFEFDLALKYLDNVLALKPENITALKFKSEILQVLGRFDEAIMVQQQLIKLTNNEKEYCYGLYNSLNGLGKLPEAVAALQTWRRLNGSSTYEKPLNPYTVQNKTVLVLADRAFGDQIQYIRLANIFKQYGATKVIFASHEKLVPLLSQCPLVDQVISINKKPYPVADFIFRQDELMYLLQVTLDSIPGTIPYINTNNELLTYYKQFISKNHLNIGICWQAKQGLFNERTAYCNRSMPLTFFKELCSIPNIQFYSLQKGQGSDEINNCGFSINPLPNDFDEHNGAFMDTAAFMKNLDLVITVDTSIGHLAGALGIPVWVLLPYTADTRWMTHRSDTPWYPTMRLFRQSSPGNWDLVIKQVITALPAFISNKGTAL